VKINILLSMFIFFYLNCPVAAFDKQIDRDLYEFYLKTQLKLSNFFKTDSDTLPISIKKILLTVWTGQYGSLQEYDFLSDEHKKEIRMNFTAYIAIKLTPRLTGNLRIARFKNQKDAITAYRDSSPYSTFIDKNTLFSGKTIDDAYICSQDGGHINKICLNFMYKGFVFLLIVGRKPSRGIPALTKNDYELADNLVLAFKDLIDKTFNPEIIKFYNTTKIPIDKFLQSRNITLFKNLNLSVWNALNSGPSSIKFSANDKLLEINQTPTLFGTLEFSSGALGYFRIARFKTYDDAFQALTNLEPHATNLTYLSLFSGQKPNDAYIFSHNDYDNCVKSCIIHKNCLLHLTINRSSLGKHSKIKTDDLFLSDNLLICFKNIISYWIEDTTELTNLNSNSINTQKLNSYKPFVDDNFYESIINIYTLHNDFNNAIKYLKILKKYYPESKKIKELENEFEMHILNPEINNITQ